MNTCIRFIATGLLTIAGMPFVVHAADLAGPGTSVANAAAIPVTSGGCTGDATLSSFQRRLIEKYDQSPEVVLHYVWRTRAIYLLDRTETALWAEAHRRTHPAC